MFVKPKYKNIKEEILHKIDVIDIYSFYLKKNIKQIPFKCKSPLRTEQNPSFSLYIYNNTIFWKDFTLGVSGDVFKLISKMFDINYNESVYKIYQEMIKNNFLLNERKIYNVHKSIKISNSSIEITPFIFKNKIPQSYFDYWEQYKVITKNILKKNNVFAVKYVMLNDTIYARYKNNDIIILYKEKRKNNNKIYRKIYRPFNKEKKWLSNYRGDSKWLIHGLSNINKTVNYIIITKSNKDKMVLEGLGYNSVNVQNEGISIPKEIINYLKSLYEYIYIFYDNDFNKSKNWGQIAAKKQKQIYPCFSNIMIPSKYECTDISEFINRYDIEKTSNLLQKLIKF